MERARVALPRARIRVPAPLQHTLCVDVLWPDAQIDSVCLEYDLVRLTVRESVGSSSSSRVDLR